ncbi:zinc finger CCHC domain-containing protein 3-like [Malaya genurostris]|uniref:zinc finger CCHC domain-containing protein 3-like n=1 Tax=Malaya genurostris TaxID=325434 RepID=UPI0026F3D938|nr:zinc finger CCHC domain-containing protein 3-like [Malaya genurostris]
MQRAESAETELAAAKIAAAAAVTLQTKPSTTSEKHQKGGRGKLAGTANTQASTPKRVRSSPGEEKPGASKKQRDTLGRRIDVGQRDEEVEGATNNGTPETPRQVVGGRKDETKTRDSKRKPPGDKKFRKKGEALIVKTSAEDYLEILRTIRLAPELKELDTDVFKIRRTRTEDMIFELKKNSKNKSSYYKDIIQKFVGNKAEVKAMTAEATLQCENLDEITTEEEVKNALKKACQMADAEFNVRLRRGILGMQVAVIKLPVEAANKALEIGKIRVGWAICPLSIHQQPEVCFKCQGFGHVARNCKGPDRTKLCRRCGEEGHKTRGCSKPPKCLICANENDNNHVTGGLRCPAFKKAAAAKPQWR